jgi:hypothetical protein
MNLLSSARTSLNRDVLVDEILASSPNLQRDLSLQLEHGAPTRESEIHLRAFLIGRGESRHS